MSVTKDVLGQNDEEKRKKLEDYLETLVNLIKQEETHDGWMRISEYFETWKELLRAHP